MDISVLRDINDWWVTGKVSDTFLEPVPRKITPEIIETLDERQIILLEGPRRVGKTSIMFHIIQAIIERGVDPGRIIYISLDDPLINKERFFEELINIIEKHLIGRRLQSIKETVYLFLDEVTHLKDWELYLKRYYDLKYPLKFIVSSSSASFLVKKGRESLVGRLFRFNIMPFLFSEFLELMSANELIIKHQKKINALWEDFSESLDANNFISGLHKISKSIELHIKDIDILLHRFLLNGGFPEFLQLKGERAIRQYFPENVIERVVYHDIPETFNVADRALLQNLLMYSIFHSGSIININEIAASCNATRQTVSDYLYYLQSSMLIRLLEKYAKTEVSRLRAFRKLYTVDSGLYVHLQRLSPSQIEQKGALGRLAEIAVFAQLKSYSAVSENLFYFRERDMEVDFVVRTPKGLIPVEVKYREAPKDLRGIKYFMQRFNASKAIVITKDMLKKEDNILFVPLRLFLS
jgi:predicted AAA+ superfamily ATPase